MALTVGERALGQLLAGTPTTLTPELLALARRHRIHYLLAASGMGVASGAEEGRELARELRQAAAIDAWTEEDLRALFDALSRSGVEVLILKGAALAQLVYEAPHLRPRVDTDILIRREQLEAAEAVLAALGWSRPAEAEFEIAGAQRHYTKAGPAATACHLDVHWRIANPRLFADALSFDAISARAVAVPSLGTAAHAPCHVDALFLCCLHRVAHHGDEADLLWLWDIHLLASRLTAAETTDFAGLAGRTGMIGVCTRGLELAVSAFDSAAAAAVAARLRALGDGRDEPASRFLDGAASFAVLRADLSALGWRERLGLLVEHVCPSASYMRAIYPTWPLPLLWLAYVHRVVRGAPKWFRRPRV